MRALAPFDFRFLIFPSEILSMHMVQELHLEVSVFARSVGGAPVQRAAMQHHAISTIPAAFLKLVNVRANDGCATGA